MEVACIREVRRLTPKVARYQAKFKAAIYTGLRRIPLNCIHHWRLYFCKIWVYPKNNSKKMGLALKNLMKRWFLVRPEEFGTNWSSSLKNSLFFVCTPTEILHIYNLPVKNSIGPLKCNRPLKLVHLLNLLANLIIGVNIKLKSAI